MHIIWHHYQPIIQYMVAGGAELLFYEYIFIVLYIIIKKFGRVKV